MKGLGLLLSVTASFFGTLRWPAINGASFGATSANAKRKDACGGASVQLATSLSQTIQSSSRPLNVNNLIWDLVSKSTSCADAMVTQQLLRYHTLVMTKDGSLRVFH